MIQYATEEMMEDAFVAYLKSVLPGTVDVFAAMTRDEVVFPSVIVMVQSTDNPNEVSGWNNQRIMEMQIKLGVEAADVKENGVVSKLLRDQNAELRAAVLDALTIPDLAAKINEIGIVRVSLVTIGKIVRGVEGRIMETAIPLAILT
jgi:hypothetical protein